MPWFLILFIQDRVARLKIPRRPATFPGSRYSLWHAGPLIRPNFPTIFRSRSHGGTAVLFIAERASLPFRPIIDPLPDA